MQSPINKEFVALIFYIYYKYIDLTAPTYTNPPLSRTVSNYTPKIQATVNSTKNPPTDKCVFHLASSINLS